MVNIMIDVFEITTVAYLDGLTAASIAGIIYCLRKIYDDCNS